MKVQAILQARVSSSRLPGKILKMVSGKPMLLHQIERIQYSEMIDKLVVATSIDESDDQLVSLIMDWGVEFFRGSLDDVLGRYYQAASIKKYEHIVRLTGDCPLIDHRIIDNVIRFHIKGGFDYTSNAVLPTFPDGLDVEVFRYTALKKAWKNAVLPSDREHVNPWISNRPSEFLIGSFVSNQDNSGLRWTVDEHEDLIFIKNVYKNLYKYNPLFSMDNILDLLRKKPELLSINSSIKRNAGMDTSIKKDMEFLNGK